MKTQHPHARRRRARGATAVLVGVLALLCFAFFRVQIVRSSTYKLQAESNRLRPLEIPAPRGTVFDRNGRVIADNVPAYAVSILPAPRDSMIATLRRLQPILRLDGERVEEIVGQMGPSVLQPLSVVRDADFQDVSALEERRTEFPNVFVEMRPKRRYVSGPAVAHILGHIGEITAEELGTEFFPEDRYEQRMIVGKTGIEREYEHILQGTGGVRYVEVDARGRIVGDFGGSTVQPPMAGEDIRLNVDLELQEWIHRIFPKDKTGAVVALDPADGGVLALYSYPTFDPNAFVGGVDRELYVHLQSDTLKPMYNRAVQGVFPPASTFKPAVAAMALDAGLLDADEYMDIPCTGGMTYGGQYRRCWYAAGHGYQDLAAAIQNSCNVYFFQVGLRLGLDDFLAAGQEMGLSRRCGIDLPNEAAGTFPGSREFWQERYNYRPNEGEVLSLSIGQGPNSQSPLKMAQFFVALARDGTAPAPQLFSGGDIEEGYELELSGEHLAAIRQGLRQVVGPGGTGYLNSLQYWDLMGKSGSGENYLSQQGLGETDAWFIGIAGPRGGEPEIVVAVMVEQGGGGSVNAGPIVAKAADFYLRKKYGLPIDTIQTLRQHLQLRGWPSWAQN